MKIGMWDPAAIWTMALDSAARDSLSRERNAMNASIKLPIVIALVMASGSARAEHSDLARVQSASAEFVRNFNDGNSARLGDLYVRQGILKLPGQLAVKGRQTVVGAWQAGFDAGLSNLSLEVDVLVPVGPQRVLESGTYRLEIRTPNGVIVQTGTFAVLWKVPWNNRRTPKIIFDAIDAD